MSYIHGGKYRVSKGFDMIFHEEISVRRYFGISREKSQISRDISVIIVWSTRVRPATVPANALQWLHFLAAERI